MVHLISRCITTILYYLNDIVYVLVSVPGEQRSVYVLLRLDFSVLPLQRPSRPD
jgi:hypothetical protein